MIDLHCHILDEISRGPESFAETLAMCRLAVEDGVEMIVATPRWEAQASEPPLAFTDCERKLDHLRHEMRGALLFKLGFLMQFSSNLPALVERYGASLTFGGGRYVLVSLPSLRTPPETEEVWGELLERGFSVLVARPECSPDLRRNPARLGQWVASGVMLQIDAASITGAHGREAQRFAEQCMRKYEDGVVIASNAGPRRQSLSRARAEVVKKIDGRRARMLVSETPAKIINMTEAKLGGVIGSPRQRPFATYLRSFKPWKTRADTS